MGLGVGHTTQSAPTTGPGSRNLTPGADVIILAGRKNPGRPRSEKSIGVQGMKWLGLTATLGIIVRFWLWRRGIVVSKHWRGLYAVSVWEKRLWRYAIWAAERRWARGRSRSELPIGLPRQQSLLVRRLAGGDLVLQMNKVYNLRLAAARLDGLLIRPGERFSFWRTVGMPTARRGFKEGLVLVGSRLRPEVGGGLCQLSNLLYWIFLHSPLTVTERHRHGLDLFPDEERGRPFGTGATVFYNYLDLRARNDTRLAFQIRVGLTADHLWGELRCSAEPAHSYRLEERDHAFYRVGGKGFRRNRVWRLVTDRRNGDEVGAELVCANDCEVCYPVPDGVSNREA